MVYARAMTEPRICTNCQAPITTTGGRPPSDGRWSCERRPCVAARARYRRAQKSGVDTQRIEDRGCSFCGCPLPPRPWRVTDIEEGRWCRKTLCCEMKAWVLRALQLEGVEQIQKLTEIFNDSRKMGRIDCRGCGTSEAVRGFPHPKPYTSVMRGNLEICRALTSFLVTDTAVLYTWPDSFASSEEQAKQIKDQLAANAAQELQEREAARRRAQREYERRRETRRRRR